MSDNLYGAPGAIEPNLGDQMDPLGTANQQAFGQPAQGATPANAAIGASPAGPVKIGKVSPKKKLSTGKKIAYGAGGLLAVLLGLSIVVTPDSPPINVNPVPPAAAPAALGQMSAPGASVDSTTVMGGSPAAAPVEGAIDVQPPVAATAGVDALLAAPTPAQPAPAKVAHVVQPAASAPAPAEKLVLTKEKAQAVGAASDELASRVAMLEKRLARYERDEARQRALAAKAVKAAAQPRVSALAPAPSYRPVAAAPAAEVRKPAVASYDSVRVIGVSTRHGVTTALVDIGGIKQRVATGETISGLGTVESVAVDAAGVPIVEVNGVRYQ
jgi:hypothetical protein